MVAAKAVLAPADRVAGMSALFGVAAVDERRVNRCSGRGAAGHGQRRDGRGVGVRTGKVVGVVVVVVARGDLDVVGVAVPGVVVVVVLGRRFVRGRTAEEVGRLGAGGSVALGADEDASATEDGHVVEGDDGGRDEEDAEGFR